MTNLPKSLREALAAKVNVGGVEQVARQVSSDGSRKYLLRYPDGVTVECVGMPTKNRLAVCASTQAGCAMGCAFCATGAAGLTRSLTSAEIYEQVMHVRDDFNTRVTSVVLMGQGEPFMNYDATLGALRKLNNPDGGGIGAVTSRSPPAASFPTSSVLPRSRSSSRWPSPCTPRCSPPATPSCRVSRSTPWSTCTTPWAST